ncbi:MAG: hypothetical protein H6974_11190 [Gammaproteobacteria bacterium]|nr:hypothetical protein [Gammaproteobacteria bacterium]
MTRGMVDAVFRRGQVPGPEFLTGLAQAERVNLSWLLMGEGAPYQVSPPPDWRTLPLGKQTLYFLFGGDFGLRLPLVQVQDTHPVSFVTVYSGLPTDFRDILDYLARKRQPLYIAPDGLEVDDLRLGRASNRVVAKLLQETREVDIGHLLQTESLHGLSIQPSADAYTAEEQDLIWTLRELSEEGQAILRDITQWIKKGDKKEKGEE